MTASSGGQAQSAALSSPSAVVAQNWLDPRAERSLSTFDQRHLLNVQGNTPAGRDLKAAHCWAAGAAGAEGMDGAEHLHLGIGAARDALYPAAVPGTGFTNIIRPDLTGASIYNSGGLAHLNAGAYSAPATGQWGTAGRDSIIGPDQLTLNSSLARTFRPHGKLYLDFSVTSTNTLNHAAFSSWNNLITSTQFGLPVSPGAMRSLQTTVHLRFQ
jgi:trimeric autotransporter adhesin